MNRGRGLGPVFEWLGWQVTGRLFGERKYHWLNGTSFIAKPGMHGITHSIPTGLGEFQDMGFALHFLRPGDLFVDVGANVGAYSLLAHAIGAKALAIEPASAAREILQRNAQLNGHDIEIFAGAAGDREGRAFLTTDRNTCNRIAESGEEIEIATLDSLLKGRAAQFIKIDVEGFETPVIDGALETLKTCPAVTIEMNEHGRDFAYDEQVLHERMLAMGYTPCRYHPLDRRIEQLAGQNPEANNTLYLRDPEEAQKTVRAAPQFLVRNRLI
ncbi:MAG: FkbM family methyltransferase [Rhodovibrionaceae bacterium]